MDRRVVARSRSVIGRAVSVGLSVGVVGALGAATLGCANTTSTATGPKSSPLPASSPSTGSSPVSATPEGSAPVSSAPDESLPAPTEGPSPADLSAVWATCQARLELVAVEEKILDPSPEVRASVQSWIHDVDVPPEVEAEWQVITKLFDRLSAVADDVPYADGEQFRKDANTAVAADPEVLRLFGDLGEDGIDGPFRQLRSGPCDPEGLAPDAGCASPEECSERWARAHADSDAVEATNLGTAGLVAPTVFGTLLALQGCATGPDAPSMVADGEQACTLTADMTRATVAWMPTTDGRWLGLLVQVSRFVPIGSAIA